MSDSMERLRFCACCPNPCRSALPDTPDAYRESQTPSALALLAILVADERVAWSPEVACAMAETGPARICRDACPYGYDIAGDVDDFRAAKEAERE